MEHGRHHVARGREPPADADPLDAARAGRPRRRVRVPLRAVQHRRAGPVPRGLDRRHPRSRRSFPISSTCRAPAHRRHDRRRDARRRARGRDRRLPQGHGRRPRGDHDDHAELDRHLGRRRTSSASAARSRPASPTRVPLVRRTFPRRPSCPSSGATRCSRDCTSGSSWLSSRSSSTRSRSTARRSGYEVRAVGFNPEAARYGGSASRATTSSRWRSPGAFAGLAGALDILGWQFRLDVTQIQGVDDRLHRDRRRAARAQHRGRRRPRRAPVRRASTPGRRPGTSTRRSSRPSSRRAWRSSSRASSSSSSAPTRDRPRCSRGAAAGEAEAPLSIVSRAPDGLAGRRGGAGRRRRHRSRRSSRCRRSRPHPGRADRDRPRRADDRASARGSAASGGSAATRSRRASLGLVIGVPRDPVERREPRRGRRLGRAVRSDASVRDAARLRVARRPVLRALAAS